MAGNGTQAGDPMADGDHGTPTAQRREVQSLCELLEASARATPERTALVAPDGRTLTYRLLEDFSARVAGFLHTCGVKPGDRVGICLPKGLASVIALFGVLKARAAYVPVDWHGPAARNAAILHDCSVRALFLGAGRDDVLAAWPAGEPPSLLVHVMMEETGSTEKAPAIAKWPPGAFSFSAAFRYARLALAVGEPGVETGVVVVAGAAAVAARRRNDVAYILYTSGSTGVPKGVTLTHENALSFVDWCSELFAPQADDRFSSHAPFHFDLSILDLYLSLKHGATLYLIGEELGKEPKALARFAAEKRLTLWYSTPSVLALMAEFGGLAQLDLSALRHVFFAGEVFPVKHLRRLTQLVPKPAYWNLYGPTETNVCNFARIPLPVPDERTQPYPIGALCSHCEGLVLDEQLVEQPRGGEGLLWIAGPSLFRGYWNRPDLDANVFLERHGKRWYNTGDVVREDPAVGFIYVGRRDRMVKRRGYRIELGEIEAALQRHPALREVAIVALPDAEAGVKVRAHVTPSSAVAARPSLIDLKRFCAEVLPPYMSPDLFVFHEALPRTSTNKVDYPALARWTAVAGQPSSPPGGKP